MAAEKVRSIKEIRENILEIKKEIEPETWNKLTDLLDEIFVAYFIQANAYDVSELLDELYHYERHSSKDIHKAISDFRGMVENRRMSEAKANYEIREMIRKGKL